MLNERQRRAWAAAEAQAVGMGGISLVSRATGLSRTTVRKGHADLRDPQPIDPLHPERVRRDGAGRKTLEEKNPELAVALDILVEPLTRGEPESPLRWTCKSTRKLAGELTALGYTVSDRKVAKMLKANGYSLQANRKTLEGASHPDRNGQFEYINDTVKAFQKRGQPVISVDTKKKELVGEFRNGGREWRLRGEPDAVLVHDFITQGIGKAIPYGVYDVTANDGWVSVGIDHDTPEFATATVGRWWKKLGVQAYAGAKELLITADGGGSNSSRSRCWKAGLQRLATKTGMNITVCHFPPGTSKWNKIEHRMFSHITMNWRGQPLLSHEVVVNLIGGTTTRKGLQIKAELDRSTYATGLKVTDAEMDKLRITPAEFHGEWNYTIRPQDDA